MASTIDELVERLRALEPAQLEAMSDALDVVEAGPPVGEPLPGMSPASAAELRRAAVRNEARRWRARADLYATSLSRGQAAERLGVGTNQVTNLVSEGKLLALDGPDGLRLPEWQFDPDTRRGRLEGIERVAAVFPGRVLGLSSWMLAPQPALAGRTPREALVAGDVDAVVAVAAHLGT